MARGEGGRGGGARARGVALSGKKSNWASERWGNGRRRRKARQKRRGRERAGARMHTNTQFPTLVLIRRTLLLPLPLLPFLSLTHFLFFTARADSHAQPVGGWFHSFRLPLPVVIEVPLRQVAAVVLELERSADPPPPTLSRRRSRC